MGHATLTAALEAELANIDEKIRLHLQAREQALEPHQLEELLSQQRLELAAAVKTEAQATEASSTTLRTFDTRANKVNDECLKELEAMKQAHEATKAALIAEREALVTALTNDAAEATKRVANIRAKIDSTTALARAASRTVDLTGGTDVDMKTRAEKEATTAAAQQAQVKRLTEQLEATKRELADTTAAAEAAKAAPAPTTTIQPPMRAHTPLPTLELTNDEQLANSWHVVRAGLLLLDVQDTALDVRWQEIFGSGLSWENICNLVPADEIIQSDPQIDKTNGPVPESKIPRRVLGLLRAQLDALAALWTAKHAEDAATAEITSRAYDFISHVREEAFRVQNRKRPADTTSESHKSQQSAQASQPEIPPGQHTQLTQE